MSSYGPVRGSKASGYSAQSRHHPYGNNNNNSPGRRNNNSGGEGCFKCGESGHFKRDCPNASQKKTNDDFYNLANIEQIDWSSKELVGIKLCSYKESNKTSNQTDESIEEWKKTHSITCNIGLSNGGNDDLQSRLDNYFYQTENNEKEKEEKEDETKNKLPKPVMAFDDISFPNSISNAIKKAGFENPTPIQSVTLPMLLSGNNVIGIAQTGSGKTLAFLLPGIVHILNNCKELSNKNGNNFGESPQRSKYGNSNNKKFGKFNKNNNNKFGGYNKKRGYSSPTGLIIAPTRELACQIEAEFVKFGSKSGISQCCVYGGQSKYMQEAKLRNGVEIITATPGRLTDFFNNGMITFENISYVVIDEADRLLDMGFEPSLNYLLSNIRPDRQLCMFSATWPKEVEKLAKKYLYNKIDLKYTKDTPKENIKTCVMQVSVGQVTDGLKANENVKQIIKMVDRQNKITLLKNVINKELEENPSSKIIVFISTKRMTKLLEEMLWDDGYYVCCIHGDKEQRQRDRALNDFKQGNMQIMLATDVASRGIHVNDIKLVVNYDFPMRIEDYIHRIGRTGRANTTGTAISFFNAEMDSGRARELIKIMKDANQEIPDELMKYQYARSSKSNSRKRWYR